MTSDPMTPDPMIPNPVVSGAIGPPGAADARRVVVKVGSSSLTTPAGGLATDRVDSLVDALAAVRADGRQVVLVSSGAIAAGLAPLGLRRRPRDLAAQQAAASVGQGLLVHAYTNSFARHGLTAAQVLLTADDLVRRDHYRNARQALEALLGLGVVPVINENDTVATHEIRFGDNDRLAALVAHLVRADLLVLLSDVDALYDRPPADPAARAIDRVRQLGELSAVQVGGSGSSVGTGGMVTKLAAARIATSAGVPVLLTAASRAAAALRGEPGGTWFDAAPVRVPLRSLWLAHASEGKGQVVLDVGAVRAITERGASLLPAGVLAANGAFRAGDPVDLVDEAGTVIARGLIAFDAGELPKLLGRSTVDLARALGPGYDRELVHRDDLVLLTP